MPENGGWWFVEGGWGGGASDEFRHEDRPEAEGHRPELLGGASGGFRRGEAMRMAEELIAAIRAGVRDDEHDDDGGDAAEGGDGDGDDDDER